MESEIPIKKEEIPAKREKAVQEEYVRKCPECGSTNLIRDYERAEVVCQSCGLVIDQQIIDMGPEWRAFDQEQRVKRSRVGAPMTYSVDYKEPIIVEKNGRMQILPIGHFFDKIINSSKVEKNGAIEFTAVSGYSAVAFDSDYQIAFRPITHVSRHKVYEDLYELELEGKRKVCVTGAHSVFTVKDNEVIPAMVERLKVGDFVVAPKRIPTPEGVKNINMIKELARLPREKICNIYVRHINDEALFNQIDGCFSKEMIKNWKRHHTLPLYLAQKLNGSISPNAKIGIYSSPNEMPTKIKIDERLCRLLGYYSSEGNVKNSYHSVQFSFSRDEMEYITDVRTLVHSIFGLEAYIYPKGSAVQVEIPSKLLALFFADVLKMGENAHKKRVPPIIFSLPNELKLAFLQAYVRGDGSLYVKSERKEYWRPSVHIYTTSVNRAMSNDILALYSQLGVHANYYEGEIPEHIIASTGQLVKSSLSTGTRITNPDTVQTLGFIEGIKRRQRKGALEDLVPVPINYRKAWKCRKRIRINRDLAISIAKKFNDKKLLKLAMAPFMFLRITKIRKVKPSSEYAYDISVPKCENFVVGLGGIFAHNTIHDKGLSTMIDWRNKDFYGKEIAPRRRAQIYRLRKWQRRIRVSNATERNLAFALSELDRVASRLGLPRNVRETAAVIYRRAVEKGLIRGRSIEGVAAAALYAACRQCKVPRTLDEIADVSRVGRKEIGRTYRFIARELEMKLMPTNPTDYVARFASELRLTGEVQSKAIEILKKAAEKELTSGRGPTGVAAAAIYIASVLLGEKRTQREVAEVAGVTEVTIRNRYKELAEKLDIDITL